MVISGDRNMGLKNMYVKADDDGEWKLLADNMECIFCLDGLEIDKMKKCNICVDKQNNCICEEEKEMNKILQLYAERKEKEISKKYDKLVEEEYNKIEFVEVYNNLVDAFEGALKELFEDETNVGCKYMKETGVSYNMYEYQLNSIAIKLDIREKYNEDERKELAELHTLVNEVETMLSLANNNGNIDNVKVQEILIKYNIIDKDLKIQA